MRLVLVAITIGAVLCGAQTTVNGGRDFKGTLKTSGSLSSVDFRAAAATAPITTGTTAARLAACTQGQVYFAIDATPGQNLSFCTTTGTPGVWSAMTGGGGGGSTTAGVSYCAPSGGSGSAYACSPVLALTSYAAGIMVALTPDVNAAGGAITLNISGLGAKTVKLADGVTNPGAADLTAGTLYLLTYDGALFRIVRGVQSKAAVSHQFLTGIGADGSVTGAQPAASDITGLAASATTDATNASNLSSGALADARLSSNVAMGNRTNTYTGYNDLSGGSWRPPEATVASLPAAAGVSGRVYLVTDSGSVGSCAGGGGANRTLCRSNGSSYECVGNCSAGGGGGGTPAGANGAVQYNNGGSFGGQAFALGGAVLQRALECSVGTVSYSALTANATSQEISILANVPATFRYHHVLVQEATQFTGTPTLQAAMGTSGVGTDLSLPLTLKQGTAPQNYGYDTPRPPALGTGTYNLVLQFTGSAALGNGTVTNFTGGSVKWEVCGFQVQ
jgi:hypothetical protein